MTDTPTASVIPMRDGLTVTRDRKAEFVNHMAQCFDSFTQRNGHEPDASVFVFCGLKQPADVFWTIRGDSQGGSTTILAFAQAAISRQIINPPAED